MDMALDEIVAANRPKGVRRSSRRGGAKSQVLGHAPSNPSTRAKAAPASAGAKTVTAAATQSSEKIIVSGLPVDVTEQQVKELFHSTVGPLRSVTLHYDAQGRSKGVAEVIFSKRGDGNKAQQQYHNRLIDGKKAMRIELVVAPSQAPAATLASRVAPAPAAAGTNGAAPRSAGGKPRRGGGGGGSGRGGRRKGNERPPKSAADLDAEMEDYTTATSAPAAAPAAATAA